MLRPSNFRQAGLKTRAVLLLSGLAGANILIWLITWQAAHRYAFLLGAPGRHGSLPLLLTGAAALAYGFGLRHAVDADHISAIDNTTRKLMQQGQRPLGVGLFFSLGHSTVVVLLCIITALSAAYVQAHLPQWKNVGTVAGTLISALFLYLIGAINLAVLWGLLRAWRSGAPDAEPAPGGGLLARLLQPALRLVGRSWQMYFVGFLFGLGFDTATEVGLLALSAKSGQGGVPFWTVMLMPALFTVGMCLVDTLDGVLMLGAYGWAFVTPARKLTYNLGITLLSVLVAFVVGTYELLQVLQDRLSLRGGLWSALGRLDLDNLPVYGRPVPLGFLIVGTFAVVWGLSALVQRLRRGGAIGAPEEAA